MSGENFTSLRDVNLDFNFEISSKNIKSCLKCIHILPYQLKSLSAIGRTAIFDAISGTNRSLYQK